VLLLHFSCIFVVFSIHFTFQKCVAHRLMFTMCTRTETTFEFAKYTSSPYMDRKSPQIATIDDVTPHYIMHFQQFAAAADNLIDKKV
jgi:hypothetical protein